MYPVTTGPVTEILELVHNTATLNILRSGLVNLTGVRVLNVSGGGIQVILDTTTLFPPDVPGQQLLILNSSGSKPITITCSNGANFLGSDTGYQLSFGKNISVYWNGSEFVDNN